MYRYELALPKTEGFEKQNERIIRILETEGWKSFRNKKDYIIIKSYRNQHNFKNTQELSKYLRRYLDQNALGRIVVTRPKGTS